MLSLYLLEICPLRLFKLISLFGLVSSSCASWSSIKALAISEHARINLSFSGASFEFLGDLNFVAVSNKVSVDMLSTEGF